jgi:hypothetical protein
MFLGLLDTDPLVRGRIRTQILLSSSKDIKKNLDSFCIVPSKCNKQKILEKIVFGGVLKVSDERNRIRSWSRIGIH